MKAVILAAGKGSRLFPVTKAIAKPLLPLANRMTMEYAFDQLKACGITEICVVVGENEQEMRSALGDGAQFGVSLSFALQDKPLGLAHAVGCAEEFCGGESFALYLGDAIYSGSLAPHVWLTARSSSWLKSRRIPSRIGRLPASTFLVQKSGLESTG
jgi:glucose-1-phosphate thymidylyltransferase